MPVVHFLNVNNGGCSLIEQLSGRITVIDVCNARTPTLARQGLERFVRDAAIAEKGVNGNFNQKKYPVNPISYMKERNLNSVFRFILTHPDMDHMDGIKDFFEAFRPTNFWDTDNNAEKEFGNGNNGGFREDDWKFYKNLRDSKPTDNPKRLTLHSGGRGQYYNVDEQGKPGADGLFILAPTPKLIVAGNECGDHNDCSYVILYRTGTHRILFAGDSHDATWEHILANHKDDVKDVDLLIAPHHGRHSDRGWDFLDTVNPALTLFGNADSEHLAYSAWNNRELPFITNNQAGNVIVHAGSDPNMFVYVTCEAFAKASNSYSFYSSHFDAHYWGTASRKKAAIA